MNKQPLIILTGPTSVGKTALSIALAKAIGGEIISADSMQVYKFMDIGTAKISKSEMQGVPHYLIDELEPDEEFNVVRFQQLAKHYMQEIYERNKIPILVGGTGFYIQAVLNDIDFTENENDYAYRTELEELYEEKGASYLYHRLEDIDPESAKAIHPNNIKKVIRALEYAKQTGERISEHNKEQKEKESPYEFCYFVLNRERSKLYETINCRVDKMLQDGLVDEVKELAERGYNREMVSMQGLGYKEILSYLNGELSYEEAIDILKRDTRHFAKRQITWFKREKEVNWVNREEYASEQEILRHMIDCLKEKKIISCI